MSSRGLTCEKTWVETNKVSLEAKCVEIQGVGSGMPRSRNAQAVGLAESSNGEPPGTAG